jgi:excisionase family DNA binding protein
MTTQTDPQELLTTQETAKLLKISYATLMTWRSAKRYPLRYARIGRRIRYRRADVEAFISNRTVER